MPLDIAVISPALKFLHAVVDAQLRQGRRIQHDPVPPPRLQHYGMSASSFIHRPARFTGMANRRRPHLRRDPFAGLHSHRSRTNSIGDFNDRRIGHCWSLRTRLHSIRRTSHMIVRVIDARHCHRALQIDDLCMPIRARHNPSISPGSNNVVPRDRHGLNPWLLGHARKNMTMPQNEIRPAGRILRPHCGGERKANTKARTHSKTNIGAIRHSGLHRYLSCLRKN